MISPFFSVRHVFSTKKKQRGADDLLMFRRENKARCGPAVSEICGLSAQVHKARKARGLQTYKPAQYPLYHLYVEPLTKQRQNLQDYLVKLAVCLPACLPIIRFLISSSLRFKCQGESEADCSHSRSVVADAM